MQVVLELLGAEVTLEVLELIAYLARSLLQAVDMVLVTTISPVVMVEVLAVVAQERLVVRLALEQHHQFKVTTEELAQQ